MSDTYIFIYSLIGVFLLIISILFIYLDFFKSLFVTLFKKRRVKAKLKKFAIDHDFPLLSNVVFQIKKEVFIKIDHIMIGNKYIYVISAKSWYGYLNGKAKDPKWILYRRDKLSHIKNPLILNETRIKYLAAFLDSRIEDFVNIVYLAKPVVSKKIKSESQREFILGEDEFDKFIEVYEKECKLNDFSIKAVEKTAKKIFSYHKKSLLSFEQLSKKKIKSCQMTK